MLADLDIKNCILDGSIVIEPYSSKLLGPNSYDVCLGNQYFIADDKPNSYLCPWQLDTIQNFWGKPKDAIEITEAELLHYKLNDEFLGRKMILIPPQRTILSYTMEFIGGVKQIATKIAAKSTLGRCNITVCRCANAGSVGYVNRWCLEIQNCSVHTEAILISGEPIAQISFEQLASNPYQVYKGAYQSQNSIQDVMARWKIEDIIPQKLSFKN